MSPVLLDTHVILWALNGDPKLGREAAAMIRTSAVAYSTGSIWEIAIKSKIGKLQLPVSPATLARRLDDQGLDRIDIELDHVLTAGDLELHHRDPFDRLLVAQALEEGIPLMSGDTALHPYGATIVDPTE